MTPPPLPPANPDEHQYWTDPILYCAHSKKDYMEYLLLKDKVIYMNFLDWMSRTSREKRPQTYDEYWQCMCQYFGLFACWPVNHHVHE
ncbi:uncharacterized protein EURHEDRAFT_531196 [Aspergillus ruber CBS 135680]|uniref:Uncharacterized protein n=1 Tax=Aspergillus ruber (strain CBS 135680) TaxID=1388766 RepID=A0A017SC17_ASPRC|nr:uncharacterized protein EURHEDRAFT_531196 [Aspergillus ruber CBS 135680]EYE94548.1 hypothetical protein EURHEDRAFT_531196 [Aspergillus ruber CBS 135680]